MAATMVVGAAVVPVSRAWAQPDEPKGVAETAPDASSTSPPPDHEAPVKDPTQAADTATTTQAPGPAASPAAEPSGHRPGAHSGGRDRALGLFRLGRQRFDAGDYDGALQAFSAADEIMHAPTTGLEVARSLAMLGMLRQARVRAVVAGSHRAEPGEPESFERARKQARALTAELTQRIPTIRFEVMGPDGPLTDQATVKLELDGKRLGPADREKERPVDPGDHVVVAAAPGLVPIRTSVTVVERERRVLQLALSRGEPMEVGELEGSGGISPAAYVGFAVGGAAIVAGAITGGVTLSLASDLEEACPSKQCPDSERDALADARTLGNVSTTCFIGGALGLALGLASLTMSLTSDENEPGDMARTDGGGAAARDRVRAWVGWGSAGVAGHF